MDKDTIDDLKQFITAAVLQATSEIVTRLETLESKTGGLKADVDDLRTDVNTLTVEVRGVKVELKELKAEVKENNLRMETIADAHTEWLQKHDRQLTKLQARPA